MLEMDFEFTNLPGVPALSSDLRYQLHMSIVNSSGMFRTIHSLNLPAYSEPAMCPSDKGYVVGVYWRESARLIIFRIQLKDKFAGFLLRNCVPISFWPVLRKVKRVYSVVGGIISSQTSVPKSVIPRGRGRDVIFEAESESKDVVSKFLLGDRC